MSTTAHSGKGLEGITAANSSICFIDGDQGVLAYRGIDIHELADHSNFEEVCYLLWFGHLPNRAQLQELKLGLARERKLDASIISLLRQAPKHALPMDVLRTTVSALSYYDPEEKVNDHEANVRKAVRLTAQLAYVVAAYDRIRKGKPLIEPDRSLSHAGNFLYMLSGEIPSATAEHAFDIALILHADHELNASTFAARVVAATLSDMHSAVTAAIGALKGPLHGGDRSAQGAVARRRQRGGLSYSGSRGRVWGRPRRLRERNVGAEEESSRIRASRVSHGRSAGHPSADDVARSGRIQRQYQVVRNLAQNRGVHRRRSQA